MDRGALTGEVETLDPASVPEDEDAGRLRLEGETERLLVQRDLEPVVRLPHERDEDLVSGAQARHVPSPSRQGPRFVHGSGVARPASDPWGPRGSTRDSAAATAATASIGGPGPGVRSLRCSSMKPV
jgi:hypothetical protein